MTSSVGCAVRRTACVLVWLPVLVLGPALSLHGPAAQVTFQVLLIQAMVAGSVVAVLTSDPREQGATPYAGLAVLAVAVVLGSLQGEGWIAPWVLLVNTTPAVVRGWPSVLAVPVITAGAMVASYAAGDRDLALWSTAGGVLLAGTTTTAFLRLIETVDELRRTRTELARVAVVEERERFSRDLHDLLGHTLSVMVVKAQAVRRLAEADPAAAARHAADIEEVSRQALHDVREAVDMMRVPVLADELDGARRSLEAAGITSTITTYAEPVPPAADETLAWVVREGVTNVLRHSGAGRCAVELVEDGRELRLVVWDDGVGASTTGHGRVGGIDGLRQRVLTAGGRLDATGGADGFRLTASVPFTGRR